MPNYLVDPKGKVASPGSDGTVPPKIYYLQKVLKMKHSTIAALDGDQKKALWLGARNKGYNVQHTPLNLKLGDEFRRGR